MVLRSWQAPGIALRRRRSLRPRWQQQRDVLYDGDGSDSESEHGGREAIMSSLVSAM